MVEEEAKSKKKMIITKPFSKSMSSPSRTEKFPPPLMRFLRSNVSSKSRGRSRSSPLFFRKKNNASAATTETTQEPSSPKVTCMGQVRVRRSSNNKSKSLPKINSSSKPKRNNSSSSASSAALAEQVPCWWVRKAICCRRYFPRFHKPRCSCPLFFKWAKCSRFGYCRKVGTRDDNSSSCSSSSRVESIRKVQNHATSDDTDDQVQESKRDFVGSTPPKNALLLTRCRSAPYRSSSLASRFWGSPLKDDNDDDEDKEAVKNGVQDQQKSVIDDEQERPIVPTAMSRDEMVAAEPRFSSQSEDLESSSVDERSKLVGKSIQDLRAAAVHPLVLNRCKSEPARIAERLINPDASEPSSQDNFVINF